MVNGLVLMKLQAGKEVRCLQKVRSVKGVKTIVGTFGSWDAIAHVEAGSLDSLAALVVSKIRAIDGVQTTETLIEVII
jgi:DNA-binding Lrp family transcriptional regulator